MVPSRDVRNFSPVVMGGMVWRRLDVPGSEASWLRMWTNAIQLSGITMFQFNRSISTLTYSIRCDRKWKTQAAQIGGTLGEDRKIDLKITVDEEGRWLINGRPCRDVAGCIDLDLSFSPATNLLPLRRLDLEIGEEARVRSAWLRFPDLDLEPLEQVYRRLDKNTYRYESGGGRLQAKLTVDSNGFVTHYPKLWKLEDAPE